MRSGRHQQKVQILCCGSTDGYLGFVRHTSVGTQETDCYVSGVCEWQQSAPKSLQRVTFQAQMFTPWVRLERGPLLKPVLEFLIAWIINEPQMGSVWDICGCPDKVDHAFPTCLMHFRTQTCIKLHTQPYKTGVEELLRLGHLCQAFEATYSHLILECVRPWRFSRTLHLIWGSFETFNPSVGLSTVPQQTVQAPRQLIIKRGLSVL